MIPCSRGPQFVSSICSSVEHSMFNTSHHAGSTQQVVWVNHQQGFVIPSVNLKEKLFQILVFIRTGVIPRFTLSQVFVSIAQPPFLGPLG